MSNNFSNDMPYLSNSARRIVHEFPIRRSLFDQHGSAETAIRNLTGSRNDELVQDIERLAREVSEGRRLGGQNTFTRAVADAVTQLLAISNAANSVNAVHRRRAELQTQIDALNTQHNSPASVPASEPSTLNMPVGNLVSVLPKIEYREQHEKEFERSLEYVHVQRKILKALENRDTVPTAKEAYTWTKSIVPKGQRPTPQQALRLCYYMRSLGYDTFASVKTSYDPIKRVKTTSLRLLIANADSEKRGVGYDHLYWAHDLRTGAVLPRPYSLLRQSTQGSINTRRNALANILDLGPSFSAETIYEQFREQEQRNESVQMRGGESQTTLSDDSDEESEALRAAVEAQRAAGVEARMEERVHPSCADYVRANVGSRALQEAMRCFLGRD